MCLHKIGSILHRLHDDEQGEIPVGQILIIGMVVIPLVVALVAFGDAITKWLNEIWVRLMGETIEKPTYG